MSGTTTPKPARSVTVRNVAVIGPGHVGLTLSASPALLGHQVECTDNSLERVAQLAEGYVPITESGLTELVEEMLAAGRLRFGTELALVKTAIERNIPHTQRVVDKVASAMGDVRGRRIALLGLTFKAGTDDLRNSPAMEIAQSLVALGASVQAYDPTVDAGAFYGMEVYSSSYSACRNADALVICTEWPEFTSIDLSVLSTIMSGRVIVDARNVLDPATAVDEGFVYAGIGTGAPGVRAAEVAA